MTGGATEFLPNILDPVIPDPIDIQPLELSPIEPLPVSNTLAISDIPTLPNNSLWAPAIQEAQSQTGLVLFHYTTPEYADNIMKIGFDIDYSEDKYIYATDDPNYTPIQAQINLALSSAKPYPTALIQINVPDNMAPIMIRNVIGNLPFAPAGGGIEYIFDQNIPASCLIRIH